MIFIDCSAEIAIAQPCFHNNVHIFRSELTQQNNLFHRSEKRLLCPWKYFSIPKKANNFDKGRVELRRGRLMIKAVATLESTRVSLSGEGFNLKVDADSALSGSEHQLSSEDLTELNEREKLRRMRISKANKGNTPWNKGRKHSPGN